MSYILNVGIAYTALVVIVGNGGLYGKGLWIGYWSLIWSDDCWYLIGLLIPKFSIEYLIISVFDLIFFLIEKI